MKYSYSLLPVWESFPLPTKYRAISGLWLEAYMRTYMQSALNECNKADLYRALKRAMDSGQFNE